MKTHPFIPGLALSFFAASATFLSGSMADFQSTVLSHEPTHYWQLDGGLTSSGSAGEATLVHVGEELHFGPDVFGNEDSAWRLRAFDEVLRYDGDPVSGGGPGPDETADGVGSLTILFRTPSDIAYTGQRFLFAQGNDTGPDNAFSLFFENQNNAPANSLKLRMGNDTAVVQEADFFKPDTWYYFAVTWNEARNTPEAYWYIGEVGGELVSGERNPANRGVIGDDGPFFIGNRSNEPHNSSFRSGTNDPGHIDELALYDYELSPLRIEEQFAIASDLPPPPPTDGIKYFQAVVTEQGPAHYWKLDGDLSNSGESGGGSLAAEGIGGGFAWDLFGAPDAYEFRDQGDGLRAAFDPIPDSGGWFRDETADGVGSISFLFKAPQSFDFGGQRFLFSQGNSSGEGNALGMFFENNNNVPPNSLKLRIGNTTEAIAEPHDLEPGAWYHVAITWNEARNDSEVLWHLGEVGGDMMSGIMDIGNDAVIGDASHFIIGNNPAMGNAFRNPSGDVGTMDEFAIFHREISAEEISEQFVSLTDLPEPDLSPIEEWRMEHFGTADNDGDAADGADPSGDGVVNLLKYALGLDPNVSSRAPVSEWTPGLPVLSIETDGDERFLVLTYHRDTSKTDISYTAEAASDLGDWGTEGVVDSAVDTQGDIEIREARVSLDSGNRQFLRLTVVRTE